MSVQRVKAGMCVHCQLKGLGLWHVLAICVAEREIEMRRKSHLYSGQVFMRYFACGSGRGYKGVGMNRQGGWVTQAAFVLIAIVMISLVGFFMFSGGVLLTGSGVVDENGCVPSDFAVSGSTGGAFTIDLPLVEDAVKANIGLNQKAERISALLPNAQAADRVRYELCVGVVQGRVTKDEYNDFIDRVFPKVKEVIEQRVSIHRKADFSQSGCSDSGKPVDIAVFDDLVRLSVKEKSYTAFASIEDGMRVDVYDVAVSEEVPISPVPTPLNGRILNSYSISVDGSGEAKVRYVWKDSHYSHEGAGTGVLGITSKLFLWAASGELVVPEGVTITAAAEPFNVAVKGSCIRRSMKSFSCSGLSNPDAVLFEYGWDMWASCRGS